MKKLKLMKTLLVAVGLLLGTSAWATDLPYTIGSLTGGGYGSYPTDTYTMEGYGTYHLSFTTTNDGDTSNWWWHTWILNVQDGSGVDFAYRGDGYAWQGDTYNSNNNPTVFASSKSAGAPTEAALMNAMNGATVDMVITHKSYNIYVTATVTPAEGDAFTMNFNYLVGNASTENLSIKLMTEYATLTLNTAEQTKEYTRYFYQDFEDAETYTNGWTISGDLVTEQGTCTATSSKTLYMKNGASGNRVFSTSYTSNSAFTGAEDYIYEFDFNYGGCNANATASTLTVQSNNAAGKLFTIDKTNAAWSSAFNISNAAGTALLAEDLAGGPGYKDGSTYPSLYHFTVEGIKGDGVYLSVTNGSSTSLARTRVADFGAVTGLYSSMGKNNTAVAFDNISLKTYSAVEVVPNPTAAITGVNGTARTITLTLGLGSVDGTTMAWSTNSDMSESTAYTVPFEVSTTGTIYYQATSPTSAKSEIQSLEVVCEEITLNTPTWTKTGYSAGVSTVTLSDDQSNKLLNPATTIKYKINNGSAETYSSAISVNDGEKLTYWAEATGYTTSSEGSVTAVAPCTEPELFPMETYYRASDGSISVNTEEGAAAVINTTNYYYMYCDDARISERLVTSSTGLSNWLLRTGGIYAGNTGNYAIKGVNKGDYVTITFSKGDGNPSSGDGTLDQWNSTSTAHVFKVTATMGNFRFSYPRYGYIKSIKVQRALATPGATVGSTGFATFAANVDLDLSTLTDGFTAYFASAPAEGKVKMTKATSEKIAAGEGLLIEGSGDFTITETRDATADVDNYLVAGDGVENGIAKEDGFDKYVLGAYKESVAFFLINGTPATVPANKAYLKVPNGSGSARLAIVFDEDATGINAVENNVKMTEGYYNLAGQRVAQPTKGLYIVNGKKVVIK